MRRGVSRRKRTSVFSSSTSVSRTRADDRRLLAPRRRPSTKRRMKIFFSGKQQPGAVYGSGCASASASPLLLIGATRSMRSPEGARGAATNCSVMLWKTQRTRRAEKGGILSLPRQQTRAARAVGFLICGIFIYVELDYRCVYYSILLRDVSAYGEGRAGRVGKGGFLGRRVRP